MPYARLPLATFKAKYTAFSTLTEESYAIWALEAEGRVGGNYGDQQQSATELLTAHLLALNGVGLAAGVGTLAATGATSFKSGTFSATLSDSVVAQRAKGGYQSTVWGQQFAEIQRRLFGGPRLVGFTGTPC
ncbi:DUF4054 domain-containing protein [Novosphingobium sp. ST904]|uniref:DUF4054 domain-containing protein n=1 Tax=Novosphingobium sp. ST904 TaxID=1684385 RepID=UPI0006C8CCE3|nr:DUF4054 domain-containing protein [Novosphingobium sp. ST904]KPH66045.1 hypothetical protein ADT71_08760 [Novosphingobium sp. ST904]TCM33795.1 uncharacterized protein DUF4054 [Novosphingobium sp. ST904]